MTKEEVLILLEQNKDERGIAHMEETGVAMQSFGIVQRSKALNEKSIRVAKAIGKV